MNEFFIKKHLINAERFALYIDKSHGQDSCWEWKGCKDRLGYGRFHVGKSRSSAMLAHRVAYGIATGEEPEAVCHKCDNTSCCNPRHLFGGTRLINNRDMFNKGRNQDYSHASKGKQHGSAKLVDEQIINIRKLYATGDHSQRAIAKMFNVCQRTIAKIVNRIGWSHV